MISRGLTGQSISDAYPSHQHTSLHMLAAFDFTVGGDLCDRTAERAFRLPTLPLHSHLVFYVTPWITDGCESFVSLSRWDHFLSAGCHSFCVRYSCCLYFCAAILNVPLVSFHAFPMLWPLRFIQQHYDIVRNERIFIERGFRNIIYRLSIDSE